MKKHIFKNKINILKLGFLTTFMMLLASAAFAAFTVTVQASGGNPISGATVYFSANSSMSPYTYSATGAGGTVISPGAGPYYIRVAYNNTTTTTASSVSDNYTFYTTKVNVHVLTSAGAPINGATAYFATATTFSPYVYTNTVGGVASEEMFPGTTLHFKALVNNTTSADQAQTIDGDGATPNISTDITLHTTKVNVNVLTSTGNPINGATAYFASATTFSPYVYTNTNASGVASEEMFPGTTLHFKALVNNTTSADQAQTINGDCLAAGSVSNITFHTTQVNVHVLTSAGAPINGATAYFATATTFSPYVYTNTNASGVATKEMFPGTTLHFKALVNNTTSADQAQTINGDCLAAGSVSDIIFHTTQVNVHVLTSAGNPINGVTAYFATTTTTPYVYTNTVGGVATEEMFPSSTSLHFRASVNNTTSADQATLISGNSILSGQSTDITLYTTTVNSKFIHCSDGLGINGITTYFGTNPGVTTYVYTNTAGSGVATEEMFPGSWYLKVAPSNQVPQVTNVTVGGNSVTSGQTSTNTFSTTKVTIPGATTASYSATGASYTSFTPATGVELLPGTYYFKVNGAATGVTKTISGCTQNLSIAPTGTLTATNSSNGGCGGSYTLSGPAGATSYLWTPDAATTQSIIVNTGATYSVTATYDFTPTGAPGVATTYTVSAGAITTNTVTIKLVDSKGKGIPGGVVTYYGPIWTTFGSGTTDDSGFACMHMPAGGSYTYKVTYHGGSQQWTGAASANPVYTATTNCVSVNLKDHNGALITNESGTASYYPGVWTVLGSTGTNGFQKIELLPGTYSVQMNFHTHTQQLSATVNPTPSQQDIDFQTNLVSVNIKNCDGTILTSAASVAVPAATVDYDGGVVWKMGEATTAGTAQIELLTGTYSFAMHYNYGRQQLSSQPVSPTQTIIDFKTGNVTFSNPSNIAITFYASAWNTFAQPSMELLPGSYPFRIGGTSIAAVTVNACSAITDYIAPSGTLGITSTANGSGCGGSYTLTAPAGSKSYVWTPGGASTQSIVANATGTYSVTTSYDFTATGAISGGATYTTSVTATPNTVTVRLIDHNGNGLAGATAQYYSGGWHNFSNTTDAYGFTCVTLPAGSYSFRVLYNSGTYQFAGTYAASSNQLLTAQTENVTFNLHDHNGALLINGTASAYGLLSSNFISSNVTTTASSATNPQVELLPGAYTWYMTYNGHQASLAGSITAVGGTQPADFMTTLVTFNLHDHNGALLNNGTASAYGLLSSNFISSNVTTTASSATNPQVELLPGSYTWYMTYNGHQASLAGSVSAGGTTQSADFQTGLMTFNLYDHNGTADANLLTGGTASVYGVTAASFLGAAVTTTGSTATNPSIELLPGAYTCYMSYHGGQQTHSGISVTGGITQQYINSQTGLLTFNLYDHNGTDDANLLTGGTASIYGTTSANFLGAAVTTTGSTATNPSIELLPGSYTCYMSYHGAQVTHSGVGIVAATTQPANYQTGLLSFNLYDHSGVNPLSGGTASIYGVTSANFLGGLVATTGSTATNPGVELLPGSYTCYMSYHGAQQTHSGVPVALATTQSTDYRTILVTMNLYGGTSGNLVTGGTASIYGNTSANFLGDVTTTTDVITNPQIELLPASYTFYMTWSSVQHSQLVPINDPSWAQLVNFTNPSARYAAPAIATSGTTEFGIFPNPATDKITIKYSSADDGQTSVKVADVSGKIIINEIFQSVKGANAHDVELGNLSSGIYLLMFDNGNNSEVRKINVQH